MTTTTLCAIFGKMQQPKVMPNVIFNLPANLFQLEIERKRALFQSAKFSLLLKLNKAIVFNLSSLLL